MLGLLDLDLLVLFLLLIGTVLAFPVSGGDFALPPPPFCPIPAPRPPRPRPPPPPPCASCSNFCWIAESAAPPFFLSAGLLTSLPPDLERLLLLDLERSLLPDRDRPRLSDDDLSLFPDLDRFLRDLDLLLFTGTLLGLSSSFRPLRLPFPFLLGLILSLLRSLALLLDLLSPDSDLCLLLLSRLLRPPDLLRVLDLLEPRRREVILSVAKLTLSEISWHHRHLILSF